MTRPMLIYKIFRATEWSVLQADGSTKGAPIDIADGYIHFSTSSQARETAAKHFATEADLWLIACEAEALGKDLRWEVSRGGAKFPHLYRDLTMDDVLSAQPLPFESGTHIFPDGFS